MFAWLTGGDPGLAVLSFLWICAVIVVGEGTRRALRLPPDLTRKVIHVGVGVWALPTALLFQSAWWAALVPALFVVLNGVSYRFRLMAVIEEDGRGSPGTIYFPLSFALLILLLWPLGGRAAAVAGLYAMALGDAAASVIGRRWGRHRYTVAGATKSREGSAAMFLVSFVGILLATWPVLAGGRWEGTLPAWLPALAAALAATAAEAPAHRGLDNLTVPVAGALAFFAVQGLAG